MDLQNVISAFQHWLKSLSDGEATFYGILLTGVCGFFVWLYKRLKNKQTPAQFTDNVHAEKESIAAREIKDSSVQITNQKINVGSVKASKGGTATGVIINNKTEKNTNRDGTDGNQRE